MNVTWVFIVYAVTGDPSPQSLNVVSAGFYDNVLACAEQTVKYNSQPDNKFVSACMPIISEDHATTKN